MRVEVNRLTKELELFCDISDLADQMINEIDRCAYDVTGPIKKIVVEGDPSYMYGVPVTRLAERHKVTGGTLISAVELSTIMDRIEKIETYCIDILKNHLDNLSTAVRRLEYCKGVEDPASEINQLKARVTSVENKVLLDRINRGQ